MKARRYPRTPRSATEHIPDRDSDKEEEDDEEEDEEDEDDLVSNHSPCQYITLSPSTSHTICRRLRNSTTRPIILRRSRLSKGVQKLFMALYCDKQSAAGLRSKLN
jgi:hypothetical protein